MQAAAMEPNTRMGDPAREGQAERRQFARRIDCDRGITALPSGHGQTRGGSRRAEDDRWDRSRPGR